MGMGSSCGKSGGRIREHGLVRNRPREENNNKQKTDVKIGMQFEKKLTDAEVLSAATMSCRHSAMMGGKCRNPSMYVFTSLDDLLNHMLPLDTIKESEHEM